MASCALTSRRGELTISTVRLFIALPLPTEVQQQMALIQQELRQKLPVGSGRWLHPDDTHITLKFLGNTPESVIEQVKPLLYGIARRQKPLTLIADHLDCFPDASKPRVIYAAVDGERKKLARLQQMTQSSIEPLGFEPEQRHYTPHITLARIGRRVGSTERTQIGAEIPSFAFEPLTWQSASVSLYQSVQTDAGPRYNQLERFPFHAS